MLIQLCSVYGSFPTTIIDLSRCNRDYTAQKAENVYYLILYKESLLTLDLDHLQRAGPLHTDMSV